MQNKIWHLTFMDMLQLLLVFFIFLISVSTFKTKEYLAFWKNFPNRQEQIEHPGRFEVIRGLPFRRLPQQAEAMLNEMESMISSESDSGLNIYVTENKLSFQVSDEMAFPSGNWQLTAPMRQFLNKILVPVSKNNYLISVEGHTDDQSSPGKDNLELSLKRALEVAGYLIQSNISRDRVRVAGYGPYRPVADNLTPQGREKNRRVEINILFRSI